MVTAVKLFMIKEPKESQPAMASRARRPHEHSNGPQALNQYGDALTSASHNADDTNGGGTREF